MCSDRSLAVTVQTWPLRMAVREIDSIVSEFFVEHYGGILLIDKMPVLTFGLILAL